MHGGRRELATSGRGKRHRGLRAGSGPRECANAGRNQPSPGEARRMPVGEQGAAPEGARLRVPICEVGKTRDGCRGCGSSARQGETVGGISPRAAEASGMPACDEAAASVRGRRREGSRHLREREAGCRLARTEQPQTGGDRRQALASRGTGKMGSDCRRGSSPSKGATMDRNGPSLGEGRAMEGSR